MDGGSGDGSGLGSGEPVPRETFHIYILSFAYGILIILVVVHLVWRWQWRRIELSKFKSHVPGDSSFNCKAMRTRLREDFSRIKKLHASPMVRLINSKYDPKQFGACTGGSTVPTHWYRMKTMDAAADFVSQNAALVKDDNEGAPSSSQPPQEAHTLPLPTFVSRLEESGFLQPSQSEPNAGSTVVERCCEVYDLARYRDGVFEESHWEEFRLLLEQLQTQLPLRSSGDLPEVRGHPTGLGVSRQLTLQSHEAEKALSPGSEIFVGYGKHDPLKFRTSNDPLIATSFASTGTFESASMFPTAHPQPSVKVRPEVTEGRTSLTKAHGKKPSPIELSPLVQNFGSSDSFSDVGLDMAGCVVSPRLYPETPV